MVAPRSIRAFFNHDWTKVAAVILTLLGIGIGTEHRITLAEDHTLELAQTVQEMQKEIQCLHNEHQKLSDSGIRMATILDAIDKRHQVEDQKRMR